MTFDTNIQKQQKRLLSQVETLPEDFIAFIKKQISSASFSIDRAQLPPIERVHVVGSGAPEPGFSANWGVGAGQPPSFYKDPFSRVHLTGIAAKSTAGRVQGENIFTLPSGYRPAINHWAAVIGTVAATSVGLIVVLTDGQVQWYAGTTGAGEMIGLHTSFRAV